MSQEQALSQFCEPPQTGGQKATLGSRKLVFVSSIIPASYTTHIGAPPYPLHAPSRQSRLPLWGFTERPRHSGCGAISASLRWQNRHGGRGRQELHKPNEFRGLNAFHGISEPGCQQGRRGVEVTCQVCATWLISTAYTVDGHRECRKKEASRAGSWRNRQYRLQRRGPMLC